MKEGDFWVFGYGSLMWKTGFDYLERRTARLENYERAFALTSIRYRGTEEQPGLVVGLDWKPGRSCTGVAFRVCASVASEVRDYLSDRELVTRSYFEICTPVTLLDDGPRRGETVDAICYVLDRTHEQYAGGISPQEQARRIRLAVGPMGPNIEYFDNTVAHLAEIGIEDESLTQLSRLIHGDGDNRG
ncbi:gamma-glutamylcyclotransferase [Rhodobacteraceae bacterium NNCM2]|nr:gamma-glutamylcyclotransferase [Coraliihabitans acroporae]